MNITHDLLQDIDNTENDQNTSTAGDISSAVEVFISEDVQGKEQNKNEHELYCVSDLLSDWREGADKSTLSPCICLRLSAKELLSQPFLHDKECACLIFDEVCGYIRECTETVFVNIYAKNGYLCFEFFADASIYKDPPDASNTRVERIAELSVFAEERGAILSVEEDMTGIERFAVSFGHLDIGTVGFKANI